MKVSEDHVGTRTPALHPAITRCLFPSLLGQHQSRPCGESRLSHTLSKKAPSPCDISRGYVGSDNKHSHPSQPECYQQKLSRGPEHPLLLRSDEEPLLTWISTRPRNGEPTLPPPPGRKEAVLCTSAAMLAETEGLNSFQGLTT